MVGAADRSPADLMGQALFLLVFATLAGATAAWAAHDLRERRQLSDLAQLTAGLLTFLGAGVFLLAVSSSAWSLGLPLVPRLVAALLLASGGLATVLRADRRSVDSEDGLLRRSVLAGFALIGFGGAVVADSSIAALLVFLAALCVSVADSSARRRPTADDPEPPESELHGLRRH